MKNFVICIWFVVIFLILFILYNKKNVKKYIPILLILLILACIPIAVMPLKLVDLISNNNGTSVAIILIITLLYLIIRLGKKIYNILQIRISNDEGIYVRDMEVNYSPAILSYLQNQKLEDEKDITACILDLCAKKYLDIRKTKENNYTLEKGTNQDSNILPADEKYLYDKIVSKQKIDFYEWKEIVIKEFNKFGFLKYKHIGLTGIFFILFMLIMLLCAIVYAINPRAKLAQFLITILFTLFEIALIEPCLIIISKIIQKDEKYIAGIYTSAGVKEMKRWDKYKNFLKDYTLIKNRKIDSVIVLEKHIAYATVLDVNKDYTQSIINDLNVNYNLNLDYIKSIFKDIGENDVRL